jgi:hypothetical protein
MPELTILRTADFNAPLPPPPRYEEMLAFAEP